MGWASGSSVMNNIIEGFQNEIKGLEFDQKVHIYGVIIEALQDADWDTEDESMGIDPAFDEAMFRLCPDMREYYSEPQPEEDEPYDEESEEDY